MPCMDSFCATSCNQLIYLSSNHALLDVGRLKGITFVSKQTGVTFTGNICGCLRKSAKDCELCIWSTMELVKMGIKCKFKCQFMCFLLLLVAKKQYLCVCLTEVEGNFLIVNI